MGLESLGSRGHNLYKEYFPGKQFSFDLKKLDPDGAVETTRMAITIEELREGGFFGMVIIPENEVFVIKTSQPEPWHHFWRIVNWDFKPFPAQCDVLSAQLEHLTTKVTHLALPVVSGGKFYSPDSFGYTDLPTGFSQAVEKMDGRPPRFDRPTDEYELFRRAQHDLLKLGYSLGLETIGQVHPDNPFGMANLWFDEEKKRFIWLDTNPAIRHTGWVKPFFHFKFHQDIRRQFAQTKPTFNRVHTERFRATIEGKRDLFDETSYHNLDLYLRLYDRIWEDRARNAFVETKQISAAVGAFTQFARDIFPEIVKFPYHVLIEPIRLTYDDGFRTKFLLTGAEQALRHGLISEEEFLEAKQIVLGDRLSTPQERRKYIVLKVLLPYYFVTSQILNAIEISSLVGAFSADDKLPLGAFAIFMGEIFPPIFRHITTNLIGKMSGVDLGLTSILSAIPKYGPLLGPAGGLSSMAGNQTLWHTTVRRMVSNLSRINPAGGVGSQFEAQLYNMFGKPIERLAE